MKRNLISIAFILLGLVGAFSYKLLLVDPAFAELPNGGYGEMYGPVSYFRIPVYVIASLLVIIGVVLLLWNNRTRIEA